MKGRRAAPWIAALAAVLLHLPALRNEFVFDDRGVLLQNPLLADLSSAPRIFGAPYWNAPGLTGGLYRPITTLSFAVDRALAGGFRPAWFHAVNVLLHGAIAALVVLLALRLGLPAWAGLFAGALFAVHPVHVEAVASVVGRSEILAAGFGLGAILCGAAARRDPGRRGRVAAWAAAALFLLAMLSKESAFVLPAIAWLFDRTSPAGAKHHGRTLAGGAIAAAAIALLLRAHALGGLGGTPIPFVDNPAASAGPWQGRLAAVAVLPRIARLLVWPHPLSADYSYAQIPLPQGLLDPMLLLGLVLAAGVTIAGLRLLPRDRTLGFALLFVPLSLALTCNLLVFIGTLLAERLLYLPSVGVCLAAGALAARAGAAADRPRPRRSAAAGRALLAVGLLAVAAGAWGTLRRVGDWRDDFSLYESAARVSPRSARIRYNLGNAWLRRARFGEAETEYRRALEVYPEFADATGNLGFALLQQGRAAEAIAPLTTAANRQPRNAEVRVNLGSARRALGDRPGARAEFEAALQIQPGSATAWNNLGSLFLSGGENAEAIRSLERAVAEEPKYALYRVNLADAYNAAGRPADARAQFEEAFRLDPDASESLRGQGELALQRGDAAAAERAFRAAADGQPPSARAANFLGYLMARKGDRAAAIAAYERAIAIDPTLWDAHRSLGLLFADLPAERERAVRHLTLSLQLEPSQDGAEGLRERIRSLGGTGGGAPSR